MNGSADTLTLPPSLQRAAQRLAEEDGISLNQWVSLAVAQKIGAVETAADFFAHRTNSANGEALGRFLARVPDRGPDLEEIP